MPYTIQLSLKADLLSLLRRTNELAEKCLDEDYRVLLKAGVMPKTYLQQLVPNLDPEWITYLIKLGKIEETPSFYFPRKRDRVRPIQTQYDVEKPNLVRTNRNATTHTMSGRDRLLLWYVGANRALTGSKGESYAIFVILQFFRLPNVQRAWRRWRKEQGQIYHKIPEDAR